MPDFATTEEMQQAQPNLRTSERYALSMLRMAKVHADGTDYLCILRDVSASGVKLRLFHPLPADRQLYLDIGRGELLAMEQMWARDNHAGFRFDRTIDVDAFIADGGPHPKRPIRLRMRHPARVARGGQMHAATILDLSRQGARIETQAPLAIGERLRLDARHLPSLDAVVRWRREPDYGLVFDSSMTVDELAQSARKIGDSAL